ncbi:abortive infection protein [Acinetobacter johnsonii]|jgi:hypothetical protein|uniref:abortive infection protein n=1 Tax=Acinetobacter johnsonii TaxID=40214 RepID=UPI002296BC79|nr:abortive infection protein [Acinetobacter baumannii]HAV5507281.1 abortive infection protein [Acinetobacter baumannii]HCT9558529.1 abortive infection protein [Acinetobacter baumannii]HCU8693942.1 abortive infection protein [Acinetobacter baumannii]
MELSKKIIYENADSFNWLKELESLIRQFEIQKEVCDVTTIECCKSLLESVFKNLIVSLDQAASEKEINKSDLGELCSWVKKCLIEHEVIVELIPKEEFNLVFSSINQWIRFLGQVRNKLGEVSHGKIFPKPYSLDTTTAYFIAHNTDGFIFFLINLMIKIGRHTEKYKYEKFADFNDYLDELNPLEGKLLYSRALYDQDYDAYSEELDNYFDVQGIEVS